jgi:hypothetical protein
MKLYICYEDKGPNGVCGQTVEATQHYNKLFIIEGEIYDEIKQKLEKIEVLFLDSKTRKSPKFTNYYWEDDDKEFGLGYDVVYH